MIPTRLRPTFQVPATRGRMGTTDYYTATLPFGAVVKLFTFDPDKMMELSVEERTQRELKRKRVPEIASYILDHEDYIFSAVTVSVDSAVEFTPAVEGADVGTLVLPLEAKYVINDGQHRVAGIEEALKQDPELADDTISVVVLPDGGLERSQQIFSDLNRTVHRTSKSLDILFDHRLPINGITMDCLQQVPLFVNRVDKERVSLSVRSPKFATLSGLQQANVQLLGSLSEKLPQADVDDMRALAVDFWTRLTELVVPWKAILEGDTKPPEARQLYVSSYALSLWALGSAGAAARAVHNGSTGSWTEALDGLGDIDWKKTNPDWQGICMIGNEVVTRVPTRRATANYIKWKLGLEAERPARVITDDPTRRTLRRDHSADRERSRFAGPQRTTRSHDTPKGLAALAQQLEPDSRIAHDDTDTPNANEQATGEQAETAAQTDTPESLPPRRSRAHGDLWRRRAERFPPHNPQHSAQYAAEKRQVVCRWVEWALSKGIDPGTRDRSASEEFLSQGGTRGHYSDNTLTSYRRHLDEWFRTDHVLLDTGWEFFNTKTKAEQDAERRSAVEARIASAIPAVVPHNDSIDWPSLIGADIIWTQDGLPTLARTPDYVASLGIDTVDLVIAGVQIGQFSVYRDEIVAVPGRWDYDPDGRREIRKWLKADKQAAT